MESRIVLWQQSSYELYELEDELDEFQKAGDYSVILDGNDEAVCVIRDYAAR